MSATVQQLLQQGVQSARSGNHVEARLVLRQVLAAEPRNEQAWLWLSAVEATNSEKIAALQQVLAINPQNAAAQRGLDLLKPTQIDFASLGQASTAAPAKASFSPPPARAAGSGLLQQPRPSFEPSSPAPPISQPAPVAAEPVKKAEPAPIQPTVAEPQATSAPENAVNYSNDLVGSLRPAIAKGPKKRSILPTRSELVISAVLMVLLVGGFNLVRAGLSGRLGGSSSPDLSASELATSEALAGWRNPNATPELEIVIEPAQGDQPTPLPIQPAQTGSLHQSRSYFLEIGETVVGAEGKQVAINVTLQNPTNKILTFRAADFTIQTNVGNLPPTSNSSLMTTLTIPANASISGNLVARTNAGEITSVKLVWRPTSGGISKTITLR